MLLRAKGARGGTIAVRAPLLIGDRIDDANVRFRGQSGHVALQMSAFDPKRTLNNPICCDAQVQLYFGGMVGYDPRVRSP
jgi:hypothetical protein